MRPTARGLPGVLVGSGLALLGWTTQPGLQHAAERDAPAVAAFAGSREQVLKAYANLPLTFVENRGQTDTRVRYYAQGPRYAFYLTREEVVLSFVKGSDALDPTPGARGSVALALRFLGGNPQVVMEGEERAPGDVNYFRGNDPALWFTQVPGYEQVVYRELWPGVDLMLRGQARELKYEFRVRPGARVADIRMGYRGSAGLALDGAGGLRIETPLGVLRDAPPVSHQQIAGARVAVESRYVVNEGGADYGFAVGAGYESDHELIIDPGLDYSTFLGGDSHETGAGIAVDASGNAYVVGTTQSPDFPTTVGAFDRTLASTNNVSDVFVSKLNATGTALIYSTYLGGSAFDVGRGIAIDGAGNAYVTGTTPSPNFPTTPGAFQPAIARVNPPPPRPDDSSDGFITKLNAAGSALAYSTFIGGTGMDDGFGIAVDTAGNAYVTGQASPGFPTRPGAFDTTPNGAFDTFATKLNPAGSALVYSTLLGGTEVEFGQYVAVDAAGNAYVLSSTRSPDFPTTAGAFDTTANGIFDVAISKLNAAGSALLYSTFLGGVDFDSPGGLAIDGAGNAYVTGGTISPNFPTTPGAFDTTLDGGSDAFVTKLDAAGSALVYSTFLGGTEGEGAGGIAVNGAGNAWVSGGTSSADFPVSPGGFDTSFNGIYDVFVTQLDAAGSAVLYSTFLGGVDSDGASSLALDPGGNVYVTGETQSEDFPTTPGALDTVFDGNPLIFWRDAFVFRLGSGEAPPPPALSALSLSPTSVVGGNSSAGTVTLTGAAPPGGAAVTLASSNTAVATVPASITVAAGATSATFTVTTSAVASPTVVTITGASGGATRTADLTVAPGGGGAPGFRSPTANAADSGGDGNGLETNPSNAHGDDTLSAADNNSGSGTSTSCTSSQKDKHRFYNYGFSIPAGESVTGIEVRLDARADSTSGAPRMCVQLSWDGGTTWTAAKATGTLGTSLATFTLGNSSDTWGRTWSASNLTNASFRLRVIDVSSSTSRDFFLDWVGVRVHTGTPAPASLSAVSLSPATVVGGNPSTGTVTLTAAAPTGGAVVTLSGNSTAATVPASVTVPAGASSATFTITTSTVTVSTPVTITGSYGGATRTATLTVNPAGAAVTLTVTASGRSGERILSNPAGINVTVGSTGSASFASGSAITLSVTNGRDAIWSGACSSGGSKTRTCTFTITGNASVTGNVQ